MKFKGVKIQAFRAYNAIEDGQFDFSLSNKDYADFISLYAPNGFGKTSFYDAIEYAFTNNISRFVKKQKFNEETAKSQKNASLQEKQFILRNNFAPIGVDSFVEINTTFDSLPIIRRTVPVPIKGGRDFKFNDKDTERKYFREVILSQEWIDAFLMVDDATERYKTFIEYFGDKKLDEYHRKLTELIILNDKRIADIKKQLAGIQKELDFSGDKEVLEKVNSKILELNTDGEKLNLITETYTESNSLDLSNIISERLNDLLFEKQKNEELHKFIDLIFSGNEEMKGITSYFTSKSKLNELLKNEKEINTFQNKFNEKIAKTITLNKFNESQQEILIKKGELENILKLFPDYLKVNEEIQKTNEDISKEKVNEDTTTKAISEFKKTELEYLNKIKQLQSEILTNEAHLKELPKLLEKDTLNRVEIDKIDNTINEESRISKLLEPLITNFEQKNKDLNSTLDEIKVGIYSSNFRKEYSELEEYISKIEINKIKLLNNNNILNQLNIKIKDQESLNKDIEQFISKGAELIDKSQKSTCILCSHEYDSFKELTESVANNQLLSGLLSTLLKERSELESLINAINEQLRTDENYIISFFNSLIASNEKKLADEKYKFSKANENIQKGNSDKAKLLSEQQSFQAILKDSTYDVYFKGCQSSIVSLKEKLISNTTLLEDSQLKLKESQSGLNLIEGQILLFRNKIQSISKDKNYLDVINYFTTNYPNQVIDIELIKQKIVDNGTEFSLSNELIVKAQEDLIVIEEFLKEVTPELIEKQLEALLYKKDTLNQIILSFEQQLNSKLDVNTGDFDNDSLIIKLKEIQSETKTLIDELEQKLKNYNLLNDLRKNVEPYLKFEKAKKTAEELKERKTFLEKKVKKNLEEERGKVSQYLDTQIRSFFYEELINDLYCRIDPHPDYKRVKFICDFKDDKPKLNVCLFKDENDLDPIIPNLYFSAAQLNILSLSIFLAKALNAKDDKGNAIDCIFIDDPVQSMDSINILSTIDLIRSLVMQGKQIILSTHDENFHSLLKKKMPPELFKSKFLELESFGKVKKVN